MYWWLWICRTTSSPVPWGRRRPLTLYPTWWGGWWMDSTGVRPSFLPGIPMRRTIFPLRRGRSCRCPTASGERREIIPQLQEYAAHPIDKPTFGSRYLGALLKAQDEDLRKQGQPGVEKVTLIGVCTDICVLSNALLVKAFLPEAEIVVEAGCCAGVTPQAHCTALEAMKACQITVVQEA